MESTFQATNRRMTVWLHLAFWLVLGVVNLLLFNWFVTPKLMVSRSLINLGFMALLFYVNANVLVNRFLEKKKYLAYFLLVNALIWVTVPVRVIINMQFPIASPGAAQPNIIMKGFIFGALATNFGIVMFSTIYQMLVNRYAHERRALALINRQNEAQLQFLRAQINPHFLFNTLNNIYSLAVVRSEKTAGMVLKLSHLLRYVIYESRQEKVPLGKEAEQLQQFIELFQMRSEEPLNIEFKREGKLDDHFIEPMILIPIVENCFKHCDFDTSRQARVKIEMAASGNRLVFNTFNTKNDADRQKDKTGGVGLENIRKRLDLMHPGEYSLGTRDNGDSFEVNFSIILK